MLKFFRKIRQRLLSENKFSKYMIYAVGEILLVVIGILIALQINNWNEGKVEKQIEKEILEGIRSDILRDTIDLDQTIRNYKFEINNDSLLLDHLIYQKPYDSSVIVMLANCLNDQNIILYNSNFEQAKQKGLSIISNRLLREEISNLYEFDHAYLLGSVNELDDLDYYPKLLADIERYIETDSSTYRNNKLNLMNSIESGNAEQWSAIASSALSINSSDYQKLLADKKFHRRLLDARECKRYILNTQFLKVRDKSVKLANAINEELEKFD